MSQKHEGNDLTNGLIIGIGLGILSGIASTLWYKKHQMIDPSFVLENIKTAFLKEGPIEGSWIEFEKKPLHKFAIHSKTYHGGVYRLEDGQMISYQFIADALTGTVIDVTREVA